MLDLIRKTLGLGSTDGSAQTAASGPALLASVVLLWAAHADHECSDEELDHVVQTIRNTYGLTPEQVDELLEFAHSERTEATDLHHFTRQINQQMDREEKLALVEDVWRLIYADGVVDKHEEHFARKLSNLLWLEHRDFIDAKLKARDGAGR